ncbi:MAG: hypothetical protein M1839_009445 [Geoglossum umbratile]|nr:MAG: hypothetical protein M1839_009445 [Geoglossum umbratile]
MAPAPSKFVHPSRPTINSRFTKPPHLADASMRTQYRNPTSSSFPTALTASKPTTHAQQNPALTPGTDMLSEYFPTASPSNAPKTTTTTTPSRSAILVSGVDLSEYLLPPAAAKSPRSSASPSPSPTPSQSSSASLVDAATPLQRWLGDDQRFERVLLGLPDQAADWFPDEVR